ncbi:MAG TPA: type II toxin-antitoxin system VapC family toxin [Candidatus Margulisiibacteriota bacterium]|nr:type II toxin-antitoxin system VapC family toxin [Candidatus Margulisiibacteriota bacterium]
MKFLVDTHCWLWLQVSPTRLSAETLALLADPANDLLLSAASSWEIAIKYMLGKLPLPLPPAQYVPERMAASGTHALPVEHAHALQVAALPTHHRDPFDRLLIAQAQLEKLVLVTVDRQLDRYDVDIRFAN